MNKQKQPDEERKLTIQFEFPLEKILRPFESIIKNQINEASSKAHEEKLLSPRETCRMFHPPISRPTLDKLVKRGVLTKHYMGRNVYFKYSDLLNALKSYKRYEKGKQD